MTTIGADSGQRFYRDRDRAFLGGVCAGLALHFGLNLKVTRVLTVIAFFAAMPFAVVGYLAAVFLFPSASSVEAGHRYARDPDWDIGRRRRSRKHRQKETVEKPRPSANSLEVRRRCNELDKRLVELEKVVTSKRFQIDQELSRL
jgi:phage shock protein C